MNNPGVNPGFTFWGPFSWSGKMIFLVRNIFNLKYFIDGSIY